MDKRELETILIKHLKNKLPNINVVGECTWETLEKIGENPYYLELHKYDNTDVFDITMLKYNSEPGNKEDEENMNNLYSAISSWDFIRDVMGQRPYRNFILRQKEGYYGWIKEDSSTLQFNVIFQIK